MLDRWKKSKWLILSLTVCLLCAGTWYFGYVAGEKSSGNISEQSTNEQQPLPDSNINRFSRNADMIDFSKLKFSPWNVDEASSSVKVRAKKPYTIMVYMNGSDLESEMGAATDDIIEMQKSGVNAEHVNIILFTGGTNRWQNNIIPANDCVIWEVKSNSLNKISSVGLVNMGDPGTLASFINFTMRNFPADKFGLVMWDHGGGSIVGFGNDEKFSNSYLTLLDINYALENSGAAKNKLEFLGFDSCLMATVEMAVVASNYANYLIASEDIEPYDGWDYSFLSVLNENPQINGAEFGKAIVDSFMNYYRGAGESLALSVIETAKANRVMGALGDLMKQCSHSMLVEKEASFTVLSKKRHGTKTFGIGSPRDNECDMVDIGDMGSKLSSLYPNEAANLMAELNNCVVYNRHNSNTELKGLSVYYIYGGKNMGDKLLGIYSSLNMDEDYTKYLDNFYGMLSRNNVVNRGRSSGLEGQTENTDKLISTELTLWQPIHNSPGSLIMTGILSGVDMSSFDMMKMGMNSLWPSINGKNVCLYKINSTDNSTMYAIPSVINGKDSDVVVLFNEESPHGRILGSRQKDGIVIHKGYDNISDGDKIAFYYSLRDQERKDTDWYRSDEFTVNGGLELKWSAPEGEHYYYLLMTDIQQNEHFADINAMMQLQPLSQ